MTTGQCRSARILLDWTQANLAKRAGTSAVSVGHCERGNGVSSRLFEKLRRAFEAPGYGSRAIGLFAMRQSEFGTNAGM